MHYRSMPAPAKTAVRQFLNFDMSRPKDIFVQDQLTWGTIDRPSADTSVLIVQRSALETMPEGFLDQVEVMSASRDSPMAKQSSSGRLATGSVRDDSGSVQGSANVQNLIWETASMGGGNIRTRNSLLHRGSTETRKGSTETRIF